MAMRGGGVPNPRAFQHLRFSKYRKKEMKLPMSYKNVHKRVKRLHVLGLIEEIEGEKSWRNAIMYRLTSQGLFLISLPGNAHPLRFNIYKKDIILKLHFISSLIERPLNYLWDLYRGRWLGDYIRKCCQAIVNQIERIRKSEFKFGEELLFRGDG